MPTSVTSIAGQIHPLFSDAVRRRGAAYFHDGRVILDDCTPRGGTGTVYGTHPYRVELTYDGAWQAFCTCPAFHDRGPCKHLWALALALDEAGPDGTGAADREGRVPVATHRVPPAAPVTGNPESDWRDRLERAFPWDDVRSPWEGLAPTRMELAYLLYSRYQRTSVMIVSRRQRRDGRWGSWRPYKDSDPVAPTDSLLLEAILDASLGAMDPWSRDPGHLPIEGVLADALLPELCATGRFHRATSNDLRALTDPGTEWGGPRPNSVLDYDNGPPWELRLRLLREEGEASTTLQAHLVRSGESLPIDPTDVATGRHVVSGTRILRVAGPTEWVRAFADSTPLVVPRGEERHLLRILHQHGSPPVLDVPDALVPRRGAPVPHLRIRGMEDVRNGRPNVECRITYDYDGTLVPLAQRGDVVTVPDRGPWIERDREAERDALRPFLEYGIPVDDPTVDADAMLPARHLPDAVPALIEAGWIVEADGARYRRAGGSRLSVTTGVDWFDLEGGLSFDDQTASMPALLAAARSGSHTVRLGDGSLGLLPEDWLQEWGALEAVGQVGKETIRFHRSQAWLLDALLADRPGIDMDRKFSALRRRIAAFRGIRPVREGRGFRGTLRPYQREGLGWLRFLEKLALGGCLADDMGLGKTVQVLALLDGKRARSGRAGPANPSLVVAPRSVVRNWVEEAARFAPRLRVLDYTGTGRRESLARFPEHDLIVTTYGVLRRDAALLADLTFDWAILDEAQAIKNDRSQAAKAARLLRAEHRLALSGTPVENHLGELWSIFEFLNPGMLGRSRAFREFVRGVDLPDNHRTALSAAIRPFLLRRTKEQVLDDLPGKTEQTIHCELDRRQRREYSEIRDHFRRSLLDRADSRPEHGLSRMKIHVLEALLRLRQAACHPGLVDGSRTGESSAKLDALLPLLDEIRESGHKALVFSQFTRLLAIVRARLDADGVTYEYLDGRTRKRQQKVDRFQTDPSCPFFLISLKAGGLGLNLTAADYVFLLDPWWNPAVEAQAVDRTHRIGQTRPVTAYRLICRDTVEEKVLELQQRKRALAEAIVTSDGSVLRDLTREDLEQLLS